MISIGSLHLYLLMDDEGKLIVQTSAQGDLQYLQAAGLLAMASEPESIRTMLEEQDTP